MTYLRILCKMGAWGGPCECQSSGHVCIDNDVMEGRYASWSGVSCFRLNLAILKL